MADSLLRGITMRLLPTSEQEQLMFRTANVVRSVWNKMLEINLELEAQHDKTLSGREAQYFYAGCRKYKDPDVDYMRDVSQYAIRQVFFDMEEAYKRYYKLRDKEHPYTTKVLQRCTKQQRSPRITERKYHPQFKRKKDAKIAFADRNDHCYFTVSEDGYKVYVLLCKIGLVEVQTDYVLSVGKGACKIYNPRVSYEHGRWMFSCALEYENQVPKPHDYSLGVDLNVGNLAVISYNFSFESKFYDNPNKTDKSFIRLENLINKYQSQLSVCYEYNGKGTDDPKIKYRETRRTRILKDRIAKRFKKLRNKRKDYIHKMTREIVNLLPWRIVLEDLNVQGMKHNHHLAKAISAANFAFIRHCLTYKAEELGIEVVIADRWYPSSKACCFCGEINKNLSLGDRTVTCSLYNITIDRDLNAAINLEWYVSKD